MSKNKAYFEDLTHYLMYLADQSSRPLLLNGRVELGNVEDPRLRPFSGYERGFQGVVRRDAPDPGGAHPGTEGRGDAVNVEGYKHVSWPKSWGKL